VNTLYAMPDNETFAELLALHTGYRRQQLVLHHFPDGETRVQMAAPDLDGDAVIVCTLDRPDAKVLPLMMAAATVRELGAARVGLVAPYLAYMRQDMRFHPGEAISARIFGGWLGHTFDWLVTVEPHLRLAGHGGAASASLHDARRDISASRAGGARGSTTGWLDRRPCDPTADHRTGF